ncbi:MAG: hypothetical protein KJO77_08390 [Bacteroidia bacterium]|nr:hypothetical protein [Bacteroidia bacterium]
MKTHILFLLIGLLSLSCNGQKDDKKNENDQQNEKIAAVKPEGSWKVNKEFDEQGNLIRYDSTYSWSSTERSHDLSTLDQDSLLKSFRSRFFTNFSDFRNQGFEDIFAQDSLFSKRFFGDDFFKSDFGRDFMDMDSIMVHMMERQKKFLEKYRSKWIEPEDDN